MVLFNYSTRELTAKIVYYGPGLCGKTSNLQYIHENLPGEVRGKMLSLATKTDRTLFFDFLPIDLGEIRGMKTRVQLYTVPGQVFYNETRKLVLKGADGIVFVADSQETMVGANIESFRNLEDNLKGHGIKLGEIPHVLQFNKRDLAKISSIEDLNAALNRYNAPFYESVATTGIGVQDTLKAIVKLVLLQLTRKYDPKAVPAEHQKGWTPPTAVVPPAPGPSLPPPPVRSVAVAAAPAPTVAAAPEPARAKRAAAPAAVAAPAPAAKTPDPLPSFGDVEIDGLVGEVGEFEAPQSTVILPAAASASAPIPEAPRAAPPEDGGVWLGAPEDEADLQGDPFSTAATPLTDMLAEDESRSAPPSKSAPVAEIEPTTWTPEPPAVHAPSERPVSESLRPAPVAAAPARPAAAENLVLTEVADDDALFNDPSLEIAHVPAGEAREIVVPVTVGDGAALKRYKLTIRLRLDDVD